MIDITELSKLVEALKAETQKDAITPARLADILQKVIDSISTAAADSSVKDLEKWKTAITGIGQVVTALSVGTVDALGVHLSYNMNNTADGKSKSFADNLAITDATTKKAGVMTAVQVKALNDATKNISALQKSLKALADALDSAKQNTDSSLNKESEARAQAVASIEQKLSELQCLVTSFSQNSNGNGDNLQILEGRINTEELRRTNADNDLNDKIAKLSATVNANKTATDKQLTTVQLSAEAKISEVRKMAEDNNTKIDYTIGNFDREIDNIEADIMVLKDNAGDVKSSNLRHIECRIVGNCLYIDGASKLVNEGLTPLVFRYTVKQNRESEDRAKKLDHKNRERMEAKKGWHLFFDDKKITFVNDVLEVRSDYDDKQVYETKARNLLGRVTIKEAGHKEDGREFAFIVGYGKKTFDIYKGKRFKFAIAFADMSQTSYTFNFNALKTNLAIFKVHAAVKERMIKSLNDDIEKALEASFAL